MSTYYDPLQAVLSVQGPPFPARLLEPCVVLDASGYIVAANHAAGERMGRLSEELVGDFFGIWGPGRNHADLDLIRLRQGVAETARVRSRRLGSDEEHGPTTPHSRCQGIGLTAVDFIQSCPELNLSLSLFEMPDGQRIHGNLREILATWIRFFRNASDWGGESVLQIRAAKDEFENNWLNLEFYLHHAGTFLRDSSDDSGDLHAAAATLDAAGGSFQLTIDYPEMVARLRLPLA